MDERDLSRLRDLHAEAVVLRTLIEGYEDFSRLNLITQANSAVDSKAERTKVRLSVVEAWIAAIEAAKADGYPDLPCLDVHREVIADLQHNLEGMQKALQEFCEIPLTTTGEFIVGPEVPT